MRQELKDRFIACEQPHLAADSDAWSDAECARAARQIDAWTPAFAAEQRQSWRGKNQPLVFAPFEPCLAAGEPPPSVSLPQTAVVLLAGGQGSRLGFEQPKGCFPLLGQSLFERHAKRIAHAKVPVAILTSRLNHDETVAFFRANHNFGLTDLFFFSQDTWPLLDESGRWFLSSPGEIATGANGNGSVFQALEESGLAAAFAARGVSALHIVPVDNPLADPGDARLFAFHAREGADLTVKCVEIAHAEEPAGRLVRTGSYLTIAEFAELSPEQRRQNRYANTGLLAIDLPLARRLAKQNFPLHWAQKSSLYWEGGQGVKRLAWKAERFIVDALLFAERSRAVAADRDSCFAPLKDLASIPEIERLLVEREKPLLV